jgi:hypothetical protein
MKLQTLVVPLNKTVDINGAETKYKPLAMKRPITVLF